MSANTKTTGGADASTEKKSPEEMFRDAGKGDIIVAGDKDIPIEKVGIGKYGGKVLYVKHEGNIIELYYRDEYRALRRFISGQDCQWETFPGTVNFSIKSPQKKEKKKK